MTGLDAVRRRRLDEAARQAERTLAEAREESSRLRAAAESDAQALIANARRQGEASGDSDTVHDWTAARRRARAILLGAQQAAYARLVDEATAAVRSDPRFGDLTARIADHAQRALGPGASVSTAGDEVVAARLGREVRWSPRAAVEAQIESGAIDFEVLWR